MIAPLIASPETAAPRNPTTQAAEPDVKLARFGTWYGTDDRRNDLTFWSLDIDLNPSRWRAEKTVATRGWVSLPFAREVHRRVGRSGWERRRAMAIGDALKASDILKNAVTHKPSIPNSDAYGKYHYVWFEADDGVRRYHAMSPDAGKGYEQLESAIDDYVIGHVRKRFGDFPAHRVPA